MEYFAGLQFRDFTVNKCGFKIVKIEHPGDKYEESYILEKEMQSRKHLNS